MPQIIELCVGSELFPVSRSFLGISRVIDYYDSFIENNKLSEENLATGYSIQFKRQHPTKYDQSL